MSPELDNLKEALSQFRLDIISALTNLTLEVNALESALIQQKILDGGVLAQARQAEKQKTAQRIRRALAESISPAHEHR